MYMRASAASELRKNACSHSKTAISFNILLVLQKLCRYKFHTSRLTCTDRFPNVPTKLRKSIIGGNNCSSLATLVLSLTFYPYSVGIENEI